jgi:hypothetical protein
MSLASGFESGFNLALKFNQQEREEEKQKKQFELMDVQLEAAQEDIEASKEQRDIKRQELELDKKRTNALIGTYNSQVILDQARSDGYIRQNEADELAAGDTEKAQGWTEAVTLLEHIKNLSPDPKAREEQLYYAQPQYESLRARGFDLLEISSPKTAQAFRNLDPVLQSGDFSQMNPSFANDLTQIYKSDLNLFIGKKFISNDNEEGEIVNVKMNGNIVGKENGLSAVIGATYTVNVDGEEKEYEGFLPDLKSNTIRQDLEGDDAKAVSVKDATDMMSYLRSLHIELQNNPEYARASQEMGMREIGKYRTFDPKVKDKPDTVTVRNMYDKDMETYIDAKAVAVTDLDLTANYEDQQEEVSDAIAKFQFDMPGLKLEKNENGLYVIPEEYNDNLGEYFASVQPDFNTYKQIVANNPSIATAQLKPGQRRIYGFGSVGFGFNAKREDYIDQLGDLYGKDIIDNLVGLAPETLDDEELLDYLYMQLRQNKQER